MSDEPATIAHITASRLTSQPSGEASPALPEFPPDDPTLSRAPVSYSTQHHALGLTVRFETNDARIHQAALDSFGPIVDAVEDSPTDARIRLFVHHVDDEPGVGQRQPLVRSHSGSFWIAASRSSVVSGDAASGTAMGFVSHAIASNAAYLRTAFIQSAFLLIAHARSIAAVHSACLARDGRAIMLRGDSGAGKSTLAYAALCRGFALIAEDVVFLRSRSGQTAGVVPAGDIELHGLPWTLHLLPDAAVLFPELAGLPIGERLDGRLKLRLTIEDRFPGQALSRAPLGPLVFISRAARDTPRLSTLDRADALARLTSTSIHYERDADAEYAIWDAFLAQPAYLLETCADPHANAALLDDITS